MGSLASPAERDLAADDRLTAQVQRLVGPDLVVATRRCRAETAADPEPMVSRSEQHRQGRLALGSVLAALGDPRHPFAVAFPDPRLSVSHSGELAVAVGSRRRDATGIGIDVEFRRPFPPAAARFFLDAQETADAGDGADRLLELWTVKEAVYKADPGNRTRMLRDYRLAPRAPDDPSGTGRATRGEHTFCYRVHHLGPLVLAVAQRESRRPRPAGPPHPITSGKSIR